MYYMTYGNNDYRDYVMAHSLGEWTKPVKYIAKKVVNGVTRYIYEPAKTGVQKHVTGSYWKNQERKYQRVANSARLSAKANSSGPQPTAWRGKHPYKSKVTEANRTFSDAQRKIGEARRGYSRSLRGRFESVLSNTKKRVGDFASNLIKRGRDFIDRFLMNRRVKKVMNRAEQPDEATKKKRRATASYNNTKRRTKVNRNMAIKSGAKASRQGSVAY